MTYLEIDKALVEITRGKCAECKARLDAVSKENATERKALQVEYGMYSFCGAAGFLLGYERNKARRSHYWRSMASCRRLFGWRRMGYGYELSILFCN